MNKESKETKEVKKEPKKPVSKGKKIAVIRIKGEIGLSHTRNKTLQLLNLGRKLNCVILETTPVVTGMLKKISDCITWGPISNETVAKLEEKRKKKKEKIFCLHPPRGGFERKGLKVPYKVGGAAGERDQIDTLILKML